MRLFRLKDRLLSSLWPVPLLWVAGGIGLSFVTIAIDRASDYDAVPQSVTGTPAAAQTVLSTVASSMVTLTSVVLSLTLVAVQLAMGQFSPRIVRAIMQDRGNQSAIGLFGATFAFSLLVLRDVDDTAGRVPGISIVVAYALVLVSMVALVMYLHRVGQSLRAAGLIDLVGDELRVQLDERYPKAESEQVDDPSVIRLEEPGSITHVHEGRLVEAAIRADCCLEMVPMMGDFLAVGAVLFRVSGDVSRLDRDEVTGCVILGPERTHQDDPPFGFRKLVDIAERGISQPFLDPTTTKQAIDRLHDCLRQLAPREFPSGRFLDEEGNLRLVVPTLSWDGYVRLAFDEVRLAGERTPQVTRRLMAALEDLKEVAPAHRHPPLDRQMRLLEAGVRENVSQEEDIVGALTPDQLGIGSGPDVRSPVSTDGKRGTSPVHGAGSGSAADDGRAGAARR
jgi:uncharacterized membrane protein